MAATLTSHAYKHENCDCIQRFIHCLGTCQHLTALCYAKTLPHHVIPSSHALYIYLLVPLQLCLWQMPHVPGPPQVASNLSMHTYKQNSSLPSSHREILENRSPPHVLPHPTKPPHSLQPSLSTLRNPSIPPIILIHRIRLIPIKPRRRRPPGPLNQQRALQSPHHPGRPALLAVAHGQHVAVAGRRAVARRVFEVERPVVPVLDVGRFHGLRAGD